MSYRNRCGIEKGRIEGVAEGEFVGVAIGRWETAMAMKSEGMSVDTISKVTGWNKEELVSL